MAGTLGVQGDVGYTCETASYFQLEHIQSKIEKFRLDLKRRQATSADVSMSGEVIKELFPFHNYFADAPQPLFKGKTD